MATKELPNLMRLQKTTNTPNSPDVGTIRYADGVSWTPIDGPGYYYYNGSAWVPMRGLSLGNDGYGWFDELASISNAKMPASNYPTHTNFQSAGSLQRKEYAFSVNDYVFVQPFHINHNAKPNSLAYFHVHWTTNGTSAATVRWELNVQRAKGHNQAAFGVPTQLLLPAQAASGTAYQHMIIEDTTGITLYEPDELILVTLRRVTNGGTDNADTVFGLMCDIHYQIDRMATRNKVPNFYSD